MKVTIDPDAGFCFGVERAIAAAEAELGKNNSMLCLGEIVHNTAELDRLTAKGLKVVSQDDFSSIVGEKVMFRAHGEPPETYEKARAAGIDIIDASCPIVLRLQQKIKSIYLESKGEAQIVIFGKPGHPEVIGLQGQARNSAIVVHKPEDISAINFTRPVQVFCQTTMSHESYDAICLLIQKAMKSAGNTDLTVNKSFCRQVSGRTHTLKEFALANDLIVFASDKKSSNGEFLFNVCRSVNPTSYFVHGPSELDPAWFENVESVGVTGATSTPGWLMEEVADSIENIAQQL